MTDFLLELLDKGGYLGIFFLMMAENVFPPIPSEVIMGGAGLLVAKGQMTFGTVWVVATLGTVVGNLFWFWIGKVWSEDQLKRIIDRWGRWLTFEWDEFTKRATSSANMATASSSRCGSRRSCAPLFRCPRGWRT